MNKWIKATIIVSLVAVVTLVVYDIIAVMNDPNATISVVENTIIWKFPFIGYAWCVIVSHFFSLIPTKKRYIKELVAISILILIFSFFTLFGVITVNAKLLALMGMIGFLTGSLTWSIRRIKE